MGIFLNILFWLHLIGLAAGVGGGIANSRVGPLLGSATAETRPLLWKLEHAFARTSMGGLGTLIITGLLILWLGFGWAAPNMTAFLIKMALVVVMLISVTITARAAKKAEAGDRQAALVMKRGGMTSGIVAILIVLAAVFAFE